MVVSGCVLVATLGEITAALQSGTNVGRNGNQKNCVFPKVLREFSRKWITEVWIEGNGTIQKRDDGRIIVFVGKAASPMTSCRGRV